MSCVNPSSSAEDRPDTGGGTHVGGTFDIRPEGTSSTTKNADVGRDVIVDNLGCATSDGQNLFPSWRATGQHLVECLVVAKVRMSLRRTTPLT